MRINQKNFENSALGLREAAKSIRTFVPIPAEKHERGYYVKKFENRTDAENFIKGIPNAFVMGK